MPSIDTPYFGINYGWNLGENGWNVGMDENLLVIAFLLKGSVDSFESALPDNPSQGQSLILTTENKAYFYAGDSWIFLDLVEGFEFNRLDDSTRWVYTSGSFVEVPTSESISTGLNNLQIIVDDLTDRVDNLETTTSAILADASDLGVTSDSVTKTLAEWMIFVRDRANHTGTQEASTIEDFANEVLDAVSSGISSQTLVVSFNAGILSLEVRTDTFEEIVSSAGVLDLSNTSGTYHTTLTEDITSVVLPTASLGKNELVIQIDQDSTGSWTVTGWPVIDWLEGDEPVINPVADSTTFIRLWNVGNNGWYGSDVTAVYALRAELGSAAFSEDADFATSAQGALADSAVQPDDLETVATSGEASDVSIADAGDYFTSSEVEGALQELGSAVGDISAALDAINGEVI